MQLFTLIFYSIMGIIILIFEKYGIAVLWFWQLAMWGFIFLHENVIKTKNEYIKILIEYTKMLENKL